MNMEDVLSDKQPELPLETQEVKAEPVVETKAEPVVEQQTEQKTEPEKVEPKTEPEVKEELTAKERAFLARAQDETRKRQELEQRLREVETRQPQAEAKQFWDDPEGHLKAFEQHIAGITTNTRLQTAEMIARSKYQDFDEKLEIFKGILEQTPGLWQQALASPDPAEFVYKTGKNYKDLQSAGNLESLKAKMEKEIRIKVEEEYKAKLEAEQKERASIPSSLSDARGTTQNKVVWDGPTPLGNILSD